MTTRRRVLAGLGGGALGTLAGCSSGGGGSAPGTAPDDADVIVGPGGRFVFDPDDLTTAVGETVTWFFETAGHNVCARPGDSRAVELPDGAAPFASYGPDEPIGTLVPAGGTYEHAPETPGTYVYVCIPHQAQGMVGRIHVEA